MSVVCATIVAALCGTAGLCGGVSSNPARGPVPSGEAAHFGQSFMAPPVQTGTVLSPGSPLGIIDLDFIDLDFIDLDFMDKAKRGLEKGAKKTEKGIKKGAEKTEEGIDKGAKKVKRALD